MKRYKDVEYVWSVSGELNAPQSHINYDHIEGCHMRKCKVIRQALCSASSAISGDAAEGGARIFGIVQSYFFRRIEGEIWGQNPHPNVCGLVTSNEPKHNVWLKNQVY